MKRWFILVVSIFTVFLSSCTNKKQDDNKVNVMSEELLKIMAGNYTFDKAEEIAYGGSGEDVYFSSSLDDVVVTLQKGRYFYKSDYLFVEEDKLFEVKTKAGQLYHFNEYLAEGLPDRQLLISHNGVTKRWLLTYNGKEGKEEIVLSSKKDEVVMSDFFLDYLKGLLVKAYEFKSVNFKQNDALLQEGVAMALSITDPMDSSLEGAQQVEIPFWLVKEYYSAIVGVRDEDYQGNPLVYDERYDSYYYLMNAFPLEMKVQIDQVEMVKEDEFLIKASVEDKQYEVVAVPYHSILHFKILSLKEKE